MLGRAIPFAAAVRILCASAIVCLAASPAAATRPGARKDLGETARTAPAIAMALPRTAPWPRPAPQTAAPVSLPPAAPPPPAAPSAETLACLKRLSDGLAVATPLPAITGPNGCGASHPVRLEAVRTRAGRQVALQPPADLQCNMAEAVAHWVRDDLTPLTGAGQPALAAIVTAASYDCRGRNRREGAKLSEHGLANALDVRALKLADGKILGLTDRAVATELRLKARESACGRFTTVLGPDSDGYHEKHIHLDLIQRRSGFRLCQWAVHEPAPAGQQAPVVATLPQAGGGTPMPRPVPRAGPALKPLPAVRTGVKPPFPLVERPAVAAIARPPAPRPRPRADRSASCREARACPPTASRRRARAHRRAVARPLVDLRAIFRW